MLGAVRQVVAADDHTACVTEEGDLFLWGRQQPLQARPNDMVQRIMVSDDERDGIVRVPKEISLPERVVGLSTGQHCSAVTTESGALYTWGQRQPPLRGMGAAFDVLGHGNALQIHRAAPTRVQALEGQVVCQVSCGKAHMLCATEAPLIFFTSFSRLPPSSPAHLHLPYIVGWEALLVGKQLHGGSWHGYSR